VFVLRASARKLLDFPLSRSHNSHSSGLSLGRGLSLVSMGKTHCQGHQDPSKSVPIFLRGTEANSKMVTVTVIRFLFPSPAKLTLSFPTWLNLFLILTLPSKDSMLNLLAASFTVRRPPNKILCLKSLWPSRFSVDISKPPVPYI
jgi:hypothetical protein